MLPLIYVLIILDPQQHFFDIHEQIGTRWKDLARKLSVDDSIVDTIEVEERRVKDQCYRMLLTYRNSAGQEFTKIKLVRALFAIGLRSVAEENELCAVISNENVENNRITISNLTNKPEKLVFFIVLIISIIIILLL